MPLIGIDPVLGVGNKIPLSLYMYILYIVFACYGTICIYYGGGGGQGCIGSDIILKKNYSLYYVG